MIHDFALIKTILSEARNGRMFVLVDDHDRENEGDVVIAAQMATPAAINFMTLHARGLICLALTAERAEALGLELQPRRNESRFGTAFTVSIEAREGITTGISASDRACTIASAINPAKGREDIATPGHVFPLVARRGGVLERAGHTEAAVDVMRLAGLIPAAVICEIMKEDGTMARRDDLNRFAHDHKLAIATVADLIAYRLRHESIVTCIAETEIKSAYGGHFKAMIFRNHITHAEHIALTKGDITTESPVIVRVHALDITSDLLADYRGESKSLLQRSMDIITDHGRGAVIIIHDSRPTALSENLCSHVNQTDALRDYGIGAQILINLGIREMILLSNTERPIIGLAGYGLKVIERWPIPSDRLTS